MSSYRFHKLSNYNINEPYVFWQNGFSEDELQYIIDYCDGLSIKDGTVQDNATLNKKVRKSGVAWIELNNETEWLYDRLGFISNRLNTEFFGFDLFGFREHFQFTTYTADNDFYEWHADTTGRFECPRKLSIVLQLSDPSEYEGGDLEIFGTTVTKVQKEKGTVVAFPSWAIHRVTPVTSGVRKTIVVWLTGPSFK